ncbi:MAG TPA: HEAT repeat domain-containing protein [Myxococcaceae bacterium]|jgi:hypothetical protein
MDIKQFFEKLRSSDLGPLERWAYTELDSAELARQACDIIRDYEAHPEKFPSPGPSRSNFSSLVTIFQQARVPEAQAVLRAEALPVLLRLYDGRLAVWRQTHGRGGYDSQAHELLFALKIFALYGGPEGLQRILEAARLPVGPEEGMWPVVFGALAACDPQEALRLGTALREPLPPDDLGVALLDMANTLSREHGLPHLFDTPKGHERLRALLTDTNENFFFRAHSAAASLPFLTNPRPLFALAEEHPDLPVRMEAAWARARMGERAGLERLVEWAQSPMTRYNAVVYLKELGAKPPPSEPPELDAMADLCHWLEHPSELGRLPDSVELYDHRRLFWPPTGDERDVWLVRYRCEDDDPPEGVGMVGSETFVLFNTTSADMPPEDIYALHCCWELQQQGDPRAPSELSVAAGRKLLGFPVH